MMPYNPQDPYRGAQQAEAMILADMQVRANMLALIQAFREDPRIQSIVDGEFKRPDQSYDGLKINGYDPNKAIIEIDTRLDMAPNHQISKFDQTLEKGFYVGISDPILINKQSSWESMIFLCDQLKEHGLLSDVSRPARYGFFADNPQDAFVVGLSILVAGKVDASLPGSRKISIDEEALAKLIVDFQKNPLKIPCPNVYALFNKPAPATAPTNNL